MGKNLVHEKGISVSSLSMGLQFRLGIRQTQSWEFGSEPRYVVLHCLSFFLAFRFLIRVSDSVRNIVFTSRRESPDNESLVLPV